MRCCFIRAAVPARRFLRGLAWGFILSSMILTPRSALAVAWNRVGTVTTMTNGQICRTDGTNIICDNITPSILSTGSVGIGTAAPIVSLDLSKRSDALALPVGSTEPTSPINGMIRYSTTYNDLESYINGAWTSLTTGGDSAAIYLGTSASASDPARNGDATTGLFSAATSTVSVAVGGVEAMRVISTGSVGIGTSSPLSQLDNTVNSATGLISNLFTVRSTGTYPVNFMNVISTFGLSETDFNGNAISLRGSDLQLRNTGSITGILSNQASSLPVNIQGSVLTFKTATSTSSVSFNEAMRITGSGSVGIGTTAPLVSLDMASLHDAIALPVGTTGQRPTTGVANGDIRYNSSGTGAVEAYINSNWQSLLAGSLSSGLILGTSASVTNPQRSGDVTTGLFSPAISTVAVSAAGTQELTVTNTGVGIGTSSPANNLSVYGTSNVNGIGFSGSTTGNAPTISAVGSDSNITLGLQPKGTGGVLISSNAFPSTNRVLKF
jgi:hypothetical protein